MRATLVLLMLCFAGETYGRDALNQLNWRRRAVGLRPYLPAPELRSAVEASVRAQASRGRMFHSNHRGVRSGVGYHSGHDPEGRRIKTCFAFARIAPGTRAAAAVATGRGGTYYALDISGRRGGGATKCSKCGKTH